MSTACGGKPIPSLDLELIPRMNLGKTKNVLFLGDGFTDSDEDKALFDFMTRKLRYYFTRALPFNIVKSRFNFFRVFTPSIDSGISYKEFLYNEVTNKFDIQNNGRVRVENLYGIPDLSSNARLIEKDTFFGMTYCRFRDKESVWRPSFDNLPVIWPKKGYENCVTEFVSKLKYTPDPVSSVLDSLIPQCWSVTPSTVNKALGRDKGLVCVLVNDDIFSGITLHLPREFAILPRMKNAFVCVSLGTEARFRVFPTSADEYDHTPASPTRNKYPRILHILLHEIGHSNFGLGDEYGGLDDLDAGTQQTDYITPSGTTKTCWPQYSKFSDNLCGFSNLTTNFDISLNKFSMPRLNLNELKWNEEIFPDSPHKIIPPHVEKYLTGIDSDYTGSGSPILNSGPLSLYSSDLGKTEVRTPSNQILKKYLKDNFDVTQSYMIIGLFEGGGLYNSGIYSPAGICKMRTVIDLELMRWADNDFCYICKKRIIEKLQHDQILNEPETKSILKTLAFYYDPYKRRRKDHV